MKSCVYFGLLFMQYHAISELFNILFVCRVPVREPHPQATPRFYLTAVEKNRENTGIIAMSWAGNGGLSLY